MTIVTSVDLWVAIPMHYMGDEQKVAHVEFFNVHPQLIKSMNTNIPLIEHLLFCVTGSIAAANVPSIIQIIIDRHIAGHIHVALSRVAQRFVSQHTIAVLTGQPCITNLYARAKKGDPAHVRLANCCSTAIVVPTTANTLGKLAHGIIDNTVLMMLSIFEGRVLLVPAIHPAMYRKPFVHRNIQQLKEDGYFICGPVTGGFSMSERRRQLEIGAMPEPDVVVANLEYLIRYGKLPDSISPEEHQ